MKKLMALLLAVGVTASVAGAGEVLSRNAVGYVKIDVQGGEGVDNLYLVSVPFQSLDGEPMLISEVFDAVPNGTTLSVWDDVSQVYIGYSKSSRGAWLGEAATATIETGEGVFVRIPADEAPLSLVVMGEVPDSDAVMGRLPGLTLSSIPFPVQIPLVDTVMADELPNESSISVWDADAQEYIAYSKSARGAWLGDALTAELLPGQAFFIRSDAASQSWTEVKPYTWP